MKKQTTEEYIIKKAMAQVQTPVSVSHKMEAALTGIIHSQETESKNHTENRRQTSRPWRASRIAAVAAAAVLVIGGTVFAAGRLINFNIEQNAAYSVDVAAVKEKTEQSSDTALPAEVPEVEMVVGYMTDGMIENYKGDFSYKAETEDFGYFIADLYMDTNGTLTKNYVTDSETLEIDGRTAAYLNGNVSTDGDWKQQYLFVSYPEFDRVVQIWGWGHADKSEMIKIAEGLELKETGKMVSTEDLSTWSNYVKVMNEQSAALSGAAKEEAAEEPLIRTATTEEMANLHTIGEPVQMAVWNETTGTEAPVSATVKEVQTADDLSLLNDAYIPDTWMELLNEDGTLKNATGQYIKFGNGMDSLHKIVAEETVPLKLVYITVDYTNLGDTDLENVWYMGTLFDLKEENGVYTISDGESGAVDRASYDEYSLYATTGFTEMYYMDVFGGQKNNNYIPEIRAGETQTVHMAWLVPEGSLGEMYLNLADGNWSQFSAEMLDAGLVDIRQ